MSFSLRIQVRLHDDCAINMSSTNDNIDLDEIYAFAVQLAKDAGQMLFEAASSRSGTISRQSHVEKESAVDLVTQTDEGKSGHLLAMLMCTASVFTTATISNARLGLAA